MPLEGTYEPNAWDVARKQVELYESSGGTKGTTLQGVPCVVLWTRGRRSGAVRKAPLVRVERDGRYVVVGSMGGAPKHPVWYLNLLADPDVSLQDGPVLGDFRARELTGDEKADWWAPATSVFPTYARYQERTEREIPVVLLEPR